MQVCRRPLAPREIDHELLWLLVSLGSFSLAALWFAARLPMPQCAFHALTGLPCPTCGATRAALQLLHGHFVASFLYNPLAFLAFCSVVIFDLYAIVVLTARARRCRFQLFSPREKRCWRALALGLIAGNWLYLLTSQS